nr:DMT family transporter [Eubacterium sp.]
MKRATLFLGAFLATFLWGSAFPCIKIGYQWMNIASSDTGSQMLFAGMRFFVAGLLVLLVGSIGSKKVLVPQRESGRLSPWWILWLLALTQTFLQYFFYYIGLAHVSGTKGSIMNAMGTLFTVLIGMIYFRNKPGICKMAGVGIGMSGVVVACFSGIGKGVSWLGEGALLISAVFIAIGNIVNKKASESQNPMLVTGWHLLLGGGMLVITGIGMDGFVEIADIHSGMLMAYLIFISAAGFGIWSYLLRHNPVENVAIFMFLTPVFGTLLSSILLREKMNQIVWISLIMVCLGIFMVQQEKPQKLE